jgi:hypothetical protein
MTDHLFSPPLPSPHSDDPDDYAYTFAPVPGRERRDGWTAERQRAFILALRATGMIATAARSVGKSHQSAYKLRHRPGADGFAKAWDRALRDARSDAMAAAIEQSVHGHFAPLFYRGHFTGMAHRYDTRVMIAALRASHARAPAKGET